MLAGQKLGKVGLVAVGYERVECDRWKTIEVGDRPAQRGDNGEVMQS